MVERAKNGHGLLLLSSRLMAAKLQVYREPMDPETQEESTTSAGVMDLARRMAASNSCAVFDQKVV